MIMELDLSRHCIKTEIRRQYNRAVSTLLKKQVHADSLETVIELTRHCLEQFDFAALRSAHRALAGGTQSHVQLLARGGQIHICVDGREILPIVRSTGSGPVKPS